MGLQRVRQDLVTDYSHTCRHMYTCKNPYTHTESHLSICKVYRWKEIDTQIPVHVCSSRTTWCPEGELKWSEVSLLSRVRFCNPMDCSPSRSSIHGILQARILEWVVISFSRRTSWPRDRTQVSLTAGRFFTIWATREVQDYHMTQKFHTWVYIWKDNNNSNLWRYMLTDIENKLLLLLLSHFSRVQLCVTPQTAAHQAPPSLGFSRQEHWSGLPFPSPKRTN